MSQFTWESEAAEETQPAQEAQPEQPVQEPAVESGALDLSVDDFSALEERILRAVNLVKRERLARAAAEERANLAEDQLRRHAPQMEQQEQELNTLRAERDHVRQRVERLLAQLDALEL
jgi:phage shock protein A